MTSSPQLIRISNGLLYISTNLGIFWFRFTKKTAVRIYVVPCILLAQPISYFLDFSILIVLGGGAGVAQSVERLTMGWTTKGSELEPSWGQEFSLLHVVQTGFGVHSTSYAMGTGGKVAGT
jgi:hypothetical protein